MQPNQGDNTMSNSNKPVAKVTLFPIIAAVWKNQNERGETFYNVSFERTYKDEAGKWQSTNNFSTGDLLLLAKVADRAHTEIYKLRASDRQAQNIDE
jgi:hypothetical protein